MSIYVKIRERAGTITIEMRWNRASGFEHETVYLKDYTTENKEEMITKRIMGIMKKAKSEGTLIYI